MSHFILAITYVTSYTCYNIGGNETVGATALSKNN